MHLDGSGGITNEVITTYSDFDGLGHFRTARTATGRDSSPALDRTVTTNYNKADSSTGALNENSPAWIINTYSSATVSENKLNADGLLERKSTKTLFLFDRSNGFLKRRRTLKTVASEVRPAGAPVTEPPFTSVATVPPHANDLVTEYGELAGNMTSEAYYGGDQQSLATTSLASLALPGPEFGMAHTYSSGALATSGYSGIGFLSVDRTIDAATGLPSSSRDPSSVETAYEYDWGGRLIWSIPTGGAATEYVYSAPINAPAEVTIRQRSGGKTGEVMTTATVKYDDLGRVSTETGSMPNGVTSSRRTTYDGRGLVASISEWGSTGLTADYTYDALGRVLTATGPDDSVVTTSYTGTKTTARSVNVATSAGGEEPLTTVETADALGRLASVLSPGGTSTTYGYDVGGKLSHVAMVANGVTQIRTFNYDGRGALQSEQHPESGLTTYTYDARGHMLTRSDARPATVSFTYDGAERLTRVAEGSVVLKTFSYDRSSADRSMGKLSSSTRFNRGLPGGDVSVIEIYRYQDTTGRLVSKETQVGTGPVFTDSYEHDALGATTSITYPNCTNCGHPSRIITNVYEQGLLTAVPGYTISGTNDGITYYRNGLVDTVTHTSVAIARTVEKQEYKIANGMPRPLAIGFSGFCNGFAGNPSLSNKAVNANTPANLSVSVPGATTFQWYEVSAAGVSAPITGQTTSTLTKTFGQTTQVWVRAGDGTCTADSNVATITVNSCLKPDATITITPAQVDRDRSGTASVPDGGASAVYTWALTGGGDITSGQGTRTIGFQVDCTGAPVTLSVTVDTCDRSSDSRGVPIGDATGATLAFAGPSVIKAGDSTTLEGQLSGTAPWTVKWSDRTQSDLTSSSVVSRTLTPPGTTTYTVTVTDDCGTVTSAPLTVTVLPAPAGLVAEATSATTVDLAWSYGGVADSFKVRRTGGGSTFTITLAGSARALTDTSRTTSTAYTYEVYAVKSGVNSSFSNTDLATTIVFGADVMPGSAMAAVDVETLRTAVDAVRTRAGLPPATVSDPGSLAGLRVRAVHFTELRAALDQARSLLGLAPTGSSSPSPATGGTIRAVHVNELRGGVK